MEENNFDLEVFLKLCSYVENKRIRTGKQWNEWKNVSEIVNNFTIDRIHLETLPFPNKFEEYLLKRLISNNGDCSNTVYISAKVLQDYYSYGVLTN